MQLYARQRLRAERVRELQKYLALAARERELQDVAERDEGVIGQRKRPGVNRGGARARIVRAEWVARWQGELALLQSKGR